MGIDFLKEPAPDATTLLRFRHLIEDNGIAKLIFDDVRDRLDKAGLLMHGGTVVDATIVAAPSSSKVSYRGIAKNLNRFFLLFASPNLVMCLRAGRQKDFCGV